jgi:hypothetical protein
MSHTVMESATNSLELVTVVSTKLSVAAAIFLGTDGKQTS